MKLIQTTINLQQMFCFYFNMSAHREIEKCLMDRNNQQVGVGKKEKKIQKTKLACSSLRNATNQISFHCRKTNGKNFYYLSFYY